MKKRRSNKTAAVTLALLFAVGSFSVTAFATGDGSSQGTIAQNLASTASTESGETVSREPSAPPESSSSAESSGQESSASSAGSSSKEEPSSSQKESSSSRTASSGKASSSKAASSKPTRSVNTQEEQVNARASQAQAAVSDPDVLSSQDWSELLSSNPQSSSSTVGGTVSSPSSASSAPNGQGGGVSAMLIAGIVLIVLGVAGIGFFVYEQFFANRRGRRGGYAGPMDISSRSEGHSTEDTEPLEFEDISSNSDGRKPDGKSALENLRPAGTVPAGAVKAAKKAVPPKPKTKSNPDLDATMPVPPVQKPAAKPTAPREPAAPKHEPAAPKAEETDTPKSQATPVRESDFDWEKFFHEDDK